MSGDIRRSNSSSSHPPSSPSVRRSASSSTDSSPISHRSTPNTSVPSSPTSPTSPKVHTTHHRTESQDRPVSPPPSQVSSHTHTTTPHTPHTSTATHHVVPTSSPTIITSSPPLVKPRPIRPTRAEEPGPRSPLSSSPTLPRRSDSIKSNSGASSEAETLAHHHKALKPGWHEVSNASSLRLKGLKRALVSVAQNVDIEYKEERKETGEAVFWLEVSCEYAGKRLHTKVNGEPFEKARADLFKAFRKEGLNLQVPNLSIRTKGLDDE